MRILALAAFVALTSCSSGWIAFETPPGSHITVEVGERAELWIYAETGGGWEDFPDWEITFTSEDPATARIAGEACAGDPTGCRAWVEGVSVGETIIHVEGTVDADVERREVTVTVTAPQ